jgi:hypothetical protein
MSPLHLGLAPATRHTDRRVSAPTHGGQASATKPLVQDGASAVCGVRPLKVGRFRGIADLRLVLTRTEKGNGFLPPGKTRSTLRCNRGLKPFAPACASTEGTQRATSRLLSLCDIYCVFGRLVAIAGRHPYPVVRLGFKPSRRGQTVSGQFDSGCLPPSHSRGDSICSGNHKASVWKLFGLIK